MNALKQTNTTRSIKELKRLRPSLRTCRYYSKAQLDPMRANFEDNVFKDWSNGFEQQKISCANNISPVQCNSPSTTDRLRLRKFSSVVCLGVSPRCLSFTGDSDEVFVQEGTCEGTHEEYYNNTSTNNDDDDSLKEKCAFAVAMAVRQMRSKYFAATRGNREYLVREDRLNGETLVTMREAKFSKNLSARIHNTQSSQMARTRLSYLIGDA